MSSRNPNPLARDLDHVLTHTGSLWEELRGARIFVTGGTGFFGCWLLESVLWANDKLGLDASVVVLTRNGPGFKKKAPHLAGHLALTLHHGDVRTFAFPVGDFSHVVHAATESSSTLDRDDPLAMFDTIVGGTRRVLELARRSGARRFLLVSSGAVYGRQPPDVTHVTEDFTGSPDPTNLRNVYAEGKRAAEMLCAVYANERLLPTIARGFAFVGPYLPLDAHFAVGNFIRDALAGGPIRVMGDGTPFRSYLYASDLAVWLWTILLRGQPLRPYNVGSQESLTIRQLALAVTQAIKEPVAVDVALQPGAGAVPDRYVPDTTRAERELGLRPTIVFVDALSRTVTWHKHRELMSTRP